MKRIGKAYYERLGRAKEWRDRDFVAAMKYHHLYPKTENVEDVLSVHNGCVGSWHCKGSYFKRVIQPMAHRIAEALHAVRDVVMNWDDRHTGLRLTD